MGGALCMTECSTSFVFHFGLIQIKKIVLSQVEFLAIDSGSIIYFPIVLWFKASKKVKANYSKKKNYYFCSLEENRFVVFI